MRKPALLAGLAAAAVAGTVAVVLASPAAAAAGCRVAYTANTWPGGFGASIAVTNLGDPITGWTLRFAFPTATQRVQSGWEATWNQPAGSTGVTATSLSHNATIGTNQTRTIGFQGTWSGSNPSPLSFTLNNIACTGSLVPTTTTRGPIGDPYPPVAAITGPIGGTVFVAGTVIPISAYAAPGFGAPSVTRVEFYADGRLIGTDTSAPYQIDWIAPAGPPRSTVNVSLTSRTIDSLGRVGTSFPRTISIITDPGPNARPVVTLTDPTNRCCYVAPVTIILTAIASDPDGDTIIRIELYSGSNLVAFGNGSQVTFSSFIAQTPGTYTFSARAYDSRGAVGVSNPVTFNVA